MTAMIDHVLKLPGMTDSKSDVDAPDRPHGDSLLTICVATLRKLFHEFVQPHP